MTTRTVDPLDTKFHQVIWSLVAIGWAVYFVYGGEAINMALGLTLGAVLATGAIWLANG